MSLFSNLLLITCLMKQGQDEDGEVRDIPGEEDGSVIVMRMTVLCLILLLLPGTEVLEGHGSIGGDVRSILPTYEKM